MSFSYKDHNNIKKEFQAYERLRLVDIEQFAEASFNRGDYAISIDFVRNIYRLLPHTKEENYKTKRIKILKQNLIKLNNGYLEKHQKFMNKNYRVLTYMVDKNLRRKKKQPYFIENEDIYNLGTLKHTVVF